MKSKRIFFVAIFLLILGVSLWWSISPKKPAESSHAAALIEPSQEPTQQITEPTLIVPPPRNASPEDLHQWWLKMSKLDQKFEWKMPIEFYGKVIDDEGLPVSAAIVSMHWTDISPNGTSERTMTADTQGNFSLNGVNGKRLIIRIKKDGYRIYDSGNRFSFEYAAYYEPEWHVPNAGNPVIFKMHKNRQADPLVVRENQEAELSSGQKRSFVIGPKGAAVMVERLPNIDTSRKGWAARISVPGGGLVISTVEFPIEAPETDYMETIEVTDKTPKPVVWQGDNGAAFFVKTQQGYGRVTVRNTPGAAWVYVTSYFNPNPASRNLEFDPAKVIKPAP
ncbi:carboxypeptidase-like regulatory domain-containing protein [Rariglobus hedericola]|uniref:Carboxypeptidase regulatory-like domain-containing protein n=1 Tax=Rariglobus hedericola TaxID=2597822 RepID=A0A556QQ14_9BACT|nr:carboxypeptidase-like regulatory domain-containing protein [Rariglobus hedericola]TSJ78736.1 carboxypeptidase regulatory-like domain-containing protein [Rariglobus hedericola]